ncbi:hypothetical protein QQS21_011899 [Conoideocrella luteorostrata]|uniref:Uncharacterized protein n=1 Tax=Conoideocrella luteorostrata TaxID=1105319 RepID=A0AAJ0FMX4_9HYPO|nr:hypothetical protein QQS21_011899 [Conoideocrella luteorostrata]
MLRYATALTLLVQTGLSGPTGSPVAMDRMSPMPNHEGVVEEYSKHQTAAERPSETLFYDDFSQPTHHHLPDSSKWKIGLGAATASPSGSFGNVSTGSILQYTDDRRNILITQNNTLKITTVRLPNGTWTSGRIETAPEWNFPCEPGHRLRVQARIKLSDNTKNTPALAAWGLGSYLRSVGSPSPSLSPSPSPPWTWAGAIDLLGAANGDTKVQQNLRCGKITMPGRRRSCREFNGLPYLDPGYLEGGVWHTLTWEFDRTKRPDRAGVVEPEPGSGSEPESMTWSVDGTRGWGFKEDRLKDDAEWKAMVAEQKNALVNFAMGGKLLTGGDGDRDGEDETSIEVDFVGVYLQRG